MQSKMEIKNFNRENDTFHEVQNYAMMCWYAKRYTSIVRQTHSIGPFLFYSITSEAHNPRTRTPNHFRKDNI